MRFQDLSEYNHDLPFHLENVLNVGWLNNESGFTQMEIPKECLTKLVQIYCGNLKNSVIIHQMRGFHQCNICGEYEIRIFCAESERFKIIGSNDILIPSKQENTYYVAPSLIIHYIEAHKYCPPDEFLNAVAQFDLSKSFNAKNVLINLCEENMKNNNIEKGSVYFVI